jgi:hypothetical protein
MSCALWLGELQVDTFSAVFLAFGYSLSAILIFTLQSGCKRVHAE